MDRYRLVKSTNEKKLKKLHKKIFPEDELEDFSRGASWILYLGRTAIGFCHIRELSTDKDTCFLARAGVTAPHRGKGLQKRMILARLRWAKKYWFNEVLTYCSKSNIASANNLIACGFKLYSPEHPWGCRNALYFSRRI